MTDVMLLIPDDYSAGGLQRSAIELRNCLDSVGCRVTVHCFKLFPEGFASRFAFVRPIVSRRLPKLLFWAATLMRLRALIGSRKPTAVIALGRFTSAILPLVCAGGHRPLLIGSERAFPHAEPIFLVDLLRRFSFRHLDMIVCQTAQIKEWFLRHLNIADEKLIVIPNVVQPARLSPERQVRTGSFNLVCVGRLAEQKGISFALDIFARVLEQVPNAMLTIVGEGPLRMQLEQKAAVLGIAERVRFTGRRSDLAETWAAADVLLFPSLYEGFPNVLAEAMANGVPAVAFDCPTGPSELIRPGYDGCLVPVGDIEGAANYCVELLKDTDKRALFGGRARSVAERYSAAHVAELWRQLVESPAATSR